jgi:hypothetical protein
MVPVRLPEPLGGWMHCTQCGAARAHEARYCSNCGATVATTAGGVTTRDVSGAGIAIGAGASASVVQQGLRGEELRGLFEAVLAHIDHRSIDHEVDKDELACTVTRIQQEAAKGEQADLGKLAHWLKTLKAVAPDVLEVTAEVLLNPAVGVVLAVRKLASAIRGGERPELKSS